MPKRSTKKLASKLQDHTNALHHLERTIQQLEALRPEASEADRKLIDAELVGCRQSLNRARRTQLRRDRY